MAEIEKMKVDPIQSRIIIIPNIFLQIYKRNRWGQRKLFREIEVRNTICDFCLDKIRDYFGYPLFGAPPVPKFVAFGTNGSPTSPSMKSLVNEVYRNEISRRVPGDKQMIYYFNLLDTEANGYALKEIALCYAVADNEIFSRATFEEIDKDSGVSVDGQWVYNFASG